VSFTLHPRLDADTEVVGDLKLSRVLILKDARYPWLVLSPRRDGLVELDDLGLEDLSQLTRELAMATRVMRGFAGVEKVNVGALGNIVRQLHMHVVGRRVGDDAWPGPVWGAGHAAVYEPAELNARRAWFADRLKLKTD
jgi:diadenosine tetraphosphate (Ap4A) HIT family hydrolase